MIITKTKVGSYVYMQKAYLLQQSQNLGESHPVPALIIGMVGFKAHLFLRHMYMYICTCTLQWLFWYLLSNLLDVFDSAVFVDVRTLHLLRDFPRLFYSGFLVRGWGFGCGSKSETTQPGDELNWFNQSAESAL